MNKEPVIHRHLCLQRQRRVIAACPLAFGEVGVKERVKSVMNYKKPTFWIVLVSVVICAVVAVCFLTNPKAERRFPSAVKLCPIWNRRKS